MSSPLRFSLHFLKNLLILFLLIFVSNAQPQTQIKPKISTVFIFGDSTVDPGNNNYIVTILKSNFPPYGRDFVNHIPTGRFTNGRLVTDFAASYVGVKDYVPPYLDPTLGMEELMSGVSFASGGSGFDPLTAKLSGAIPVEKQVEYFREYKTRVEVAIGKERTETLINKAIFIISAGTNDFVVNYFGLPIQKQIYNVSGYQQFLMQNIQQFIQSLLDEGARNLAMVGIPPMGCLPLVITLNSRDAFHERKCIETLSSVARDYNQMLQNKLEASRKNGINIFYADIYKSFNGIIQNYTKFGFDDVDTGCCGTGFFEASYLCNPKSLVCSDASKYVFWDAIHPTERTYNLLFEGLRPTIDLIIKELQHNIN